MDVWLACSKATVLCQPVVQYTPVECESMCMCVLQQEWTYIHVMQCWLCYIVLHVLCKVIKDNPMKTECVYMGCEGCDMALLPIFDSL